MFSVLISLLVLVIVIYVACEVVKLLPLPEPIKNISYLVVGLIGLLLLLRILGVWI